jgi:hypothetical protein
MQNELRKILRLETVTNAVIEFEAQRTALEIEMRLAGTLRPRLMALWKTW